ncbi:hypothetical protein HDV00_003930 [Rhizophlyctis rosea]|nr:hypothetical protein HDV00_003930 [Rhizophlyctis rosea]
MSHNRTSPEGAPNVNISKIVKVDTKTHLLLDEHGRQRLFRGVNVVYKKPPYHPSLDHFDPFTSFTDEDARLLRSLSLNSIRLAVHWAGLEPTKGTHSTEYIAAIRTIMDTCARHGIYVLLEFHQDVLARQFCGHGVPDWAFENQTDRLSGWRGFPIPNKFKAFKTADNGIPTEDQCNSITWYKLYFTFAVADAFGKRKSPSPHLTTSLPTTLTPPPPPTVYTPGPLLTAFTSYWTHITQTFKHHPNLLGYELINEPWPGNHYANPLLLLPGQASKSTLHTFYSTMASAIRTVHPEALIYFEGTTWDKHNLAPTVPGGEEWGSYSVLSYHYYKPPQSGGVETVMQRRVEDATRLGCGLFLTEFEGWYGDGSGVSKMWETVKAADTYLQSWHAWSYKTFAQGTNSTDGSIFDSAGNKRVEIERLWSRTWCSAVAGRVVEMRFWEQTGEFVVRFVVDKSVRTPTVVKVVRKVWYPDGFDVEVWPEGVTWGEGGEGEVLVSVGEGVKYGEEVKVTIKRSGKV